MVVTKRPTKRRHSDRHLFATRERRSDKYVRIALEINSLAFSDLRSFIDAAAALGEAKNINGAHWELEIGCLTELMAEQDGPLLLFDNITGYRKGFRIATNVLATPRRFALALGLPTELPKLEILRAWREKLRGLKPFPPTE